MSNHSETPPAAQRQAPKRRNNTQRDATIHGPVAEVIRKHKIAPATALGWVLQSMGGFGSKSRRHRPSEVKKWAERQGLHVTSIGGCDYVTTVAGAAAVNLINNAQHEAAVCAIELATTMAGGVSDTTGAIDWTDGEERRAGQKYADLYLYDVNDMSVTAFEIERRQKASGRYTDIVLNYEEAIEKRQITEVIYLVGSPIIGGVIKKHAATLMEAGRLNVVDIDAFFKNCLARAGVLVEGPTGI